MELGLFVTSGAAVNESATAGAIDGVTVNTAGSANAGIW